MTGQLIKWSNISPPKTQSNRLFIKCVTVNALTQHVKSPTRGSNTLDLVFSRDPLTVSQLTITDNFRFLNNVSDHAAIVFSLNITYRDLPTYNGLAYDFRRADFLSLKHYAI